MYNLNFYLFIWIALFVSMLPFMLLSSAFLVLGKIQAYLEAQKSREKMLKNIRLKKVTGRHLSTLKFDWRI